VGRFELNMKLLNDKGNYYDDMCVYDSFANNVIKECERDLDVS